MQEYREALKDTINRLLNGELSVLTFQRAFYWFYLEQVLGGLLLDEKWELYLAINAALDQTDAAVNPQEFTEWVRRTAAEIAQALEGDYRHEHIFVLQQELYLYDIYQTQIAACDSQIQQCLLDFDDQVNFVELPLPQAKYIRHKPQGNEPTFDLRTHLYRISAVDFTQIDGLGVLTVQTVLSEVGLDANRFPTVKHFTSWLGLGPGSRITGSKVKSARTRSVINRAANAFRMAAQTVGKSHSALGAFYRRLRARLGAPKAITATVHKIARIFYHL